MRKPTGPVEAVAAGEIAEAVLAAEFEVVVVVKPKAEREAVAVQRPGAGPEGPPPGAPAVPAAGSLPKRSDQGGPIEEAAKHTCPRLTGEYPV